MCVQSIHADPLRTPFQELRNHPEIPRSEHHRAAWMAQVQLPNLAPGERPTALNFLGAFLKDAESTTDHEAAIL